MERAHAAVTAVRPIYETPDEAYERKNRPLTVDQRKALREAALEDVCRPAWWSDNPKAIAEQLAAVSEAVQAKMDDAHIARLAKHLVSLAVDWQMENS